MILIYTISIALFVHFIVYKEWTNIFMIWEQLSDWRKTALMPFGFCLECTLGQVTFWTLIFSQSFIASLGLACLVTLITKLIYYLWKKLN
jgi:glycopeptide antibiotics resistance protein